jgi:predicted Zn finger-like uncharacterized protein
MIVACPACASRFRVDPAALGGAAGRRLRCAGCSHLWHYRPAPPALAAAVAPPLASASETLAIEALGIDAAAERTEPVRRVPRPLLAPPVLRAEAPTVPPLGAPSSRRAGAGRRRTVTAGLALTGLAFAGLAAAIVLAAVFGRERLAALWPSAVPRQAAVDVAPAAGAGLKVTLAPRRTRDSLVISGDIVNNAAVVRRLPRLRVTLRDGREMALASKLVDPPVASLPPGASAHFSTVFEHPSGAATAVAVTFATD